MELFKNTNINKYAIKLIEVTQSPYGPIYAFSLVKLEILKIYIKIHLKFSLSNFLSPSIFIFIEKSLIIAFVCL